MSDRLSVKDAQLRMKQAEVIGHLVAGLSFQDAASEAGIRPATITNWVQRDEHFQELLEQTTEDVTATLIASGKKRTVERIAALGPAAVAVLESDLESDNPKLRQSAAKAILSMGHRTSRNEVVVSGGIEHLITAMGGVPGAQRELSPADGD